MDTPPPERPLIPACPRCGSFRVTRAGVTPNQVPSFRCPDCGRRFVAHPRKGPVTDERKELILRLLAERLSLRAIARVTGVSRSWLQAFVNTVYQDETPWEPGPVNTQEGEIVVEADELWSYVGNKREPWWIWVALNARTRQVVGMAAGDRSEQTAQCLWDALPQAYRDRAIVATDFHAPYRAVIPEDRHAAAGKDAGLTAHIERFWCTLRQRCGRLVRKTLSFSKKWENHIGALWYFIRLYNKSRS
ncbi:IS1 family transposase [Fimbriiglobus ruber]|uniref:IS1 family transposase n=1 Tax=Fimbriiglobus ruber TaxID=1908690 RepID=UPI000B4AB4F6|nr:IS1 family transposase [Fimbriiglobus ruber]